MFYHYISNSLVLNMFPWTRNYIYLYILHKLILTLQFFVCCRLSITIDYELLSELKKKSFDKRILIYIFIHACVIRVSGVRHCWGYKYMDKSNTEFGTIKVNALCYNFRHRLQILRKWSVCRSTWNKIPGMHHSLNGSRLT